MRLTALRRATRRAVARLVSWSGGTLVYKGPLPPRPPKIVIQPTMAMAAAAYFDPHSTATFVRADGTEYTKNQWDQIADAGDAVRLVVAEGSYRNIDPQAVDPATGTTYVDTIKAKFDACRNAGQRVFGYCDAQGGRIPVGTAGTWWDLSNWPRPAGAAAPADPNNPPDHIFQCVGDQIDNWYTRFAGHIDGIYLDDGPIDCISTAARGCSWWQLHYLGTPVVTSYNEYCEHIRNHGGLVYLLAPQYDDNDPTNPGWLRALEADYLGLWEASDREAISQVINNPPEPYARLYEDAFTAWNACADSWLPWTPQDPSAAPWWGESQIPAGATGWLALTALLHGAERHVHIVNGFWEVGAGLPGTPHTPALSSQPPAVPQDAYTDARSKLDTVISLAKQRHCATIWVTEAGLGAHGAVYDTLPWYWYAEVEAVRATR